MITLIYDSVEGSAYRDGEIEFEMRKMQIYLKHNQDVSILFGSSNFLLGIRVEIKEGRIPFDQVSLFYAKRDNDEYGLAGHIPLKMDADGNIHPWPEGFCDFEEKMLMRIL